VAKPGVRSDIAGLRVREGLCRFTGGAGAVKASQRKRRRSVNNFGRLVGKGGDQVWPSRTARSVASVAPPAMVSRCSDMR
jgi:hypothetical protein